MTLKKTININPVLKSLNNGMSAVYCVVLNSSAYITFSTGAVYLCCLVWAPVHSDPDCPIAARVPGDSAGAWTPL